MKMSMSKVLQEKQNTPNLESLKKIKICVTKTNLVWVVRVQKYVIFKEGKTKKNIL